MIVATAAPIIPHLKTKINRGSSIILITAPARVEIIANFGLPSARVRISPASRSFADTHSSTTQKG